MTYKDVIAQFVARYYNPELPDKFGSGNYRCDANGLYLFGNKIAYYTSNEICSDYQGPHADSSTTKKALNYLRWQVHMTKMERSQICLFDRFGPIVLDDDIKEA